MSTLSYDATGAARKALEQHLPALVEDRIATRIFAKDHTLWGPDAEAESAVRLGWVEAATVARPLVAGILELRDALKADGVTRIVLCGMGGSSLAPEVIAGTAGVELTVLDSTDPEQVGAALADRLAETAIVVSSKSGSTLETDSQRRIFEHAFNEAGIDAKSRIIIVTDPGSPLDKASREAGYRAIFNADPNVGGRYLRPDRLWAGALGPGRRRHRVLPGRGRGSGRNPERGRAREHRTGPGDGTRRHQPAARQDRHRRGRLGNGGLCRLGRAAHRRIHRQARHRRPARGCRPISTGGYAPEPKTYWWCGS